jgi:hypothetical protein
VKRKIGLVAGCSHIAGHEIDGEMDSLYNRTSSFGSLLVNQLNYEPCNIALGGATNSGITRSILRWFDEHYDPNSMEVFVCIGWTESMRIEVPALDRPVDYHSVNQHVDWYDKSASSFYRINFGWEGHTEYEKEMIPKYLRFMSDNQLMLENWSASYILQIQHFLTSLSVPYVMCNTMHMFEPDNQFTSHLVDLIDASKYYELKTDQNSSFYWKYKNSGYDNPKAKYWHHSEEPHRLYAEELYNFIKESEHTDDQVD